MVTNDGEQINFHFDILSRVTKKALDFLSKQNWLKNSKWYLAGGTALALQTGHRRSIDLDFFSEDKQFDEKKLLTNFKNVSDWHTNFEEPGTIYGALLKAKVSFIAYPFFVPVQPPVFYGNIRILTPQDIAVMKIIAISQRGRKRDFYDLYWYARNVEPLINVIKRLKTQYPSVAHDYHHLLKALVYFEDAESDPAPVIYFKAGWRQVKNYFIKEVPAIAKILIERS